MNDLAIIILTGGSSTRLGRPKQSLQYEGKSLMQNIIEKALALDAYKNLVVTGAYRDQFNDLIPSSFETVHNANHHLGMSSSLKTGVQFIMKDQLVNHIMVMLLDQPLIPVEHYQKMIAKKEIDAGIVATKFGKMEEGHFGAPTIFSKKHFEEILSLSDSQGAKSIIKKHIDHATFVECEAAILDIDTPEDYQRLLDANKDINQAH